MSEDQGESTALVALKKRLASGDISEADRTLLERARRLRTLRVEGKTFEECSVEMGEAPRALSAFSRRPVYAALCQYFDAIEDAQDEQAMERSIRRGRIDMAGMVPLALRQLRECYRRHPAGTTRKVGSIEIDISDELIDKSDAAWATQQIVKGTGLMEPIAIPPSTLVNPTFINNTIFMSRGDDAQAAKAARTVIDVQVVDTPPVAAEGE